MTVDVTRRLLWLSTRLIIPLSIFIVSAVLLMFQAKEMFFPAQYQISVFDESRSLVPSPDRFSGEYRRHYYLSVQQPITDAALYLPELNDTIILRLNKQVLIDERHDHRTENLWNFPRLISVGDIRQGDRIEFEVMTEQADFGYLGPVYLESLSLLQPYFHRWQFIHQDLLRYLTVALFSFGLFSLVVWTLRPQERAFGAGALLMLIWAAHTLQLFVTDLPFSRAMLDWYAKVTLCWMVIAIILMIHRILGLKHPVFERGLLVYGVLSSVAMLLIAFSSPDSFWSFSSRYWDTATLLMGFYPTWQVLLAVWFKQSVQAAWVAAAGVLITACGFHDWLLVNTDWINHRWYLIHYSGFAVVFVFGGLLLKRFVDAVNQYEETNQVLDAKVEAARETIENQYREMQSLEHRALLNAERERIMRDMHDGIGGHLVACISVAESQGGDRRVIDSLKQSLQDLRLMIDSFEPIEKDVLSILAMIRERTEQQIRLIGLRYRWQVTQSQYQTDFPPDVTLQIMRVLQEVVNNIVKHSGASTITVTNQDFSAPAPAIEITISDDGCGYSSDSAEPGKGLENIRHRLARIGGSFVLKGDQHGTRATIILPLQSDWLIG